MVGLIPVGTVTPPEGTAPPVNAAAARAPASAAALPTSLPISVGFTSQFDFFCARRRSLRSRRRRSSSELGDGVRSLTNEKAQHGKGKGAKHE